MLASRADSRPGIITVRTARPSGNRRQGVGRANGLQFLDIGGRRQDFFEKHRTGPNSGEPVFPGGSLRRSSRHAHVSRRPQRAPDRHAEVNSRRSAFCSGPLDLRARADVHSVLRPDTPTRVFERNGSRCSYRQGGFADGARAPLSQRRPGQKRYPREVGLARARQARDRRPPWARDGASGRCHRTATAVMASQGSSLRLGLVTGESRCPRSPWRRAANSSGAMQFSTVRSPPELAERLLARCGKGEEGRSSQRVNPAAGSSLPSRSGSRSMGIGKSRPRS
jgi:hypothetical protein